MRSSSSVALAVSIAAGGFALPLAGQTGFEGVITFLGKPNGEGKVDTMIQTTKGSLLRLDMHAGGRHSENQMIMVFDMKTRTMTMIMPAQQMYMTNTLHLSDSAMTKDKGTVKFEDTGRSDVVAGTKCEIWAASRTDSNGVTKEGEACIAKGVGFAMFDAFGYGRRGSGDPAMAKYRQLVKEGMGVLKVWTIKDGNRVAELEAINIDRKSIPSSTFEVPAGYKKFEMPSMQRPPSP